MGEITEVLIRGVSLKIGRRILPNFLLEFFFKNRIDLIKQRPLREMVLYVDKIISVYYVIQTLRGWI